MENEKSRSLFPAYVCSFLAQVYNYVTSPPFSSLFSALSSHPKDMFQVASHPTSFAMHGHGHHQAMAIVSPNIQLPRTLAHPPFAEVSRDAIMAVAPELVNVPAEYIRRGLRPKAHQMLAGISALSSSHLPTTMPKSHVPHSMSIPIRMSGSPAQPTYPTHVLAIASSKSSANEHVFLFPVHNIVIAAHSPMTLPSPAAFKVLHGYLYNHSLEGVMKSLFPLPSGFVHGLSHHTVQSTLASGSSLHQLSSYLCSSSGSSLQVLTSHAAHVKELWQDMVILGALNLAAHNH
ncbi:hypothetical protein BJ912DRAFT_949119 [Pholiota molesta]|nr:hypothetical protein BJ912DRAFT_949119 [Pholiota molesta]